MIDSQYPTKEIRNENSNRIGLHCDVFRSELHYAADVFLSWEHVESKCIITTDTEGVYGNSTASNLSTDAADGGVEPVIRKVRRITGRLLTRH